MFDGLSQTACYTSGMVAVDKKYLNLRINIGYLWKRLPKHREELQGNRGILKESLKTRDNRGDIQLKNVRFAVLLRMDHPRDRLVFRRSVHSALLKKAFIFPIQTSFWPNRFIFTHCTACKSHSNDSAKFERNISGTYKPINIIAT